MRGSYHFNKQRQEFTKVRLSFKKIGVRVLWFFAGSIVLALGYYLISTRFLLSPEERRLARETQLMQSEYERLSREMEELNTVIDQLEERDRQIYAAVLQSTPLEMDAYANDISTYLDMVTTGGFELVYRNDSLLNRMEERSAAIGNALKNIRRMVETQQDSLDALPACFPLQRHPIEIIGATIGKRVHPFYKVSIEHNGLDLLAGLGTDVMATADGVVSKVTRSARGQGNRVEIKHGYGGYTTVYAQLSDIFVRSGQRVKRGAVIARAGSSGMSYTPHLHYEVRKDGEVMDPVHYFFMEVDPYQYHQILMTAYNMGQSLD